MGKSRKHCILWGCDHDGDRHRLVVLEGASAMPIEYDSLYFFSRSLYGFMGREERIGTSDWFRVEFVADVLSVVVSLMVVMR